MQEEKQQIQIKNFASIFQNNGINLKEFMRVCEGQEYKILIDFIETILRFFNLVQRPGRMNPISNFSQKQYLAFLELLKKLKHKFQYTIYELKVQQILKICRNQNKVKIPTPNRQILEPTPQKIQELLNNPLILNSQFRSSKLLFDYTVQDILPILTKKILSINNHDNRYEVVLKSLKLLDKIFHPVQISVQISKNTLIETRVFKTVYQSEFLKRQKQAIPKVAPIINQSLLCPSNMKIQGLLLKILKRLYFLWGDCITGPLYLNLRNISLFSNQSQISTHLIKQASIFVYKIIKQKADLKFCDMLQSSEDLHFLKQNEYFSSKACPFPNQIGTVYDTLNFELPFWDYWHWIENRGLWAYSVIIEKNNTMLSWKFWLKAHDIRFGIFKMSKMIKYQTAQEYEKQNQCKQIVKMDKYSQISDKHPVKGHIFMKPGLYHIVFDNTYSMMRGKDLYYQIQQLETIL